MTTIRNFILFFTLMSVLGIPAYADRSAMQDLADKMSSSYHSGGLPNGFTDEIVKRPKSPWHLKKYLKKLTKKKKKLWKNFVNQSDEYNDLKKWKRRRIAGRPKYELGVKHLLEVVKVYKIYKNGKHVGYVYRTDDHVQAAIYQDGAGTEIYLDTNLNVVTTSDWSA